MSNGAHGLTDADAAAVREVFDAMVAAQNAGDWDTVQGYLTSDIIGLDPRVVGLVSGTGAWRELVDATGLSDVDLQFTIEDVSGGGDVACVTSTFGGSWTEAGEEMSASGKGVNVYRREADGSWRLSHYCWNANP